MVSETFTVKTNRSTEIVDITDKVDEIIRKSGIDEGICLILIPHATAALIMNECEPNLESDFLKFFEKFVPKGDYAHNRIDDNAEAHMKSAFFGQSVCLPIKNSELVRGTWQEILLCEFDGPRERRVIVTCK